MHRPLFYAAVLALLPLGIHAQEAKHLNHRTLDGAAPYGTPIVDNRLNIHGMFNQLEGRLATEPYFRWDGQA